MTEPCTKPVLTVTLCISADQFRRLKPAFADTNTFTDYAIDYWIAIGTLLLNPVRWGRLLGFGISLFVAHNLTLEALANMSVAAGGVGGITRGPISSETPGRVSLSYAVEASTEKGGGYYNDTEYGKMFIHYARLMGAGTVYLGVGATPPGALGLNGAVWNGPYDGPAWNGPWNGPEGPGWGT